MSEPLEPRPDPIGYAFARLTAAIEDAGGLASRGQAAGLTTSDRWQLAAKLRPQLFLAMRRLGNVEKAIRRYGDTTGSNRR